MLVIVNGAPRRHTELEIPKGSLLQVLEKYINFNSFFETYPITSREFPVFVRYGVAKTHPRVDIKYFIGSDIDTDSIDNLDFSSFEESFQLNPEHGTIFEFHDGSYQKSFNPMNKNPGRRYLIKQGSSMDETVDRIFAYIKKTGGA